MRVDGLQSVPLPVLEIFGGGGTHKALGMAAHHHDLPGGKEGPVAGPWDAQVGQATFENNKLTKAETPEGVTILYEWLKSGEVAVTMIDQATGEQFNTSVNPSTKTAGPLTSVKPVMRTGETELKVEKFTAPQTVAAPATKAAGTKAETEVTGNVHIERCGYPIGNEGNVGVIIRCQDIKGEYTKFVDYRKAKYVGNGDFAYTFPTSLQPHNEINISDYIESIDELMGYVCTAQGGLAEVYGATVCVAVSAAIAAAGITIVAAPAFLSACATTVAALEIYCNTLGQDFGVPGGDDVLAQINEKYIKGKLEVEWDEPIMITPVIEALPYNIYLPSVLYAKGKDSVTKLEATYSTEEPTIAIFELSPAAPSSGTSYDAKAALKCVLAGTKVVMSIQGSDGYTDSKTTTFDEDIYATVVTLHVPGASKGVRDKCNVVMTLPDGRTIEKNASLVFGE